MKLLILLLVGFVGAAYDRRQEPGLVRFDLTPEGYSYSFATDDQITKQENGKLVNVGQKNEHITVDGSYSYVGPDGKKVTVTYVAGENGFHPKFVIGDGYKSAKVPVIARIYPGKAVESLAQG